MIYCDAISLSVGKLLRREPNSILKTHFFYINMKFKKQFYIKLKKIVQ